MIRCRSSDAWLANLESLIAEVPSVIVPEESNLLLNPPLGL